MSITFRTEFTHDVTLDRWADHGGPELNVSNDNAALLLERLGLDPADYQGGDIDADDLLGRAMVGNIGRDDGGVTAADTTVPGRVKFIDCGISSGYFADRLAALVEVATYADTKGVRVQWC